MAVDLRAAQGPPDRRPRPACARCVRRRRGAAPAGGGALARAPRRRARRASRRCSTSAVTTGGFPRAVESEAGRPPRRPAQDRRAAPARPDRAADLHDRPDEREGLRRRALGRARRRRAAPARPHRGRGRVRAARRRRWTARRSGAATASTCRAPSSRCCRTRSRREACSLVPGRAAQRGHGRDLDRRRRARRAARPSTAALIRSDARLDYGQVDRIFAGARAGAGSIAEPLSLARGARRRAARGAAGARRARRGELRAGVRVRRRGQRGRGPRRDPDRGALGDRAPDDPRQRAGRASGCEPRACARHLPRARAARPRRDRAPRGAAREPRRADAAAAEGHVAHGRRRGWSARSARACWSTSAPPAAAAGCSTSLVLRALKQAYLLAAQHRARGPREQQPTATSPRRSGAIPTWSSTARCWRRSGAGEEPPRRTTSRRSPPSAARPSGRRPRSSTTPTTCASRSCSSASLARAGLGAGVRGRGDRRDRGGRVRGFDRGDGRRGRARDSSRCAACAATGTTSTRSARR